MEEITYARWSNILKNFEMFEGISDDDIDSMLNCLQPKVVAYQKNEMIKIEENDTKRIGIILQGEVSIFKEDAAGNRVIMGKFKRYDGFGEMLAFSDFHQWNISVMAITDCSILFLTPRQILSTCSKLCDGHKRLIQNMLKIVTKKGIQLNRKIEYLSMKSMRKKICTYLMEQYHDTGEKSFIIGMNRIELAEFLNVSRPSLSRELIKMKEEGLIDYYKASFKIVDLEKIKKSV